MPGVTGSTFESAEPAAIGISETYRRCLHIMASSSFVRTCPASGLAELGGAEVIRNAAVKLRRAGLIRLTIAPEIMAEAVEPEPVTLESLGGYAGIREAVKHAIAQGLMAQAGSGYPRGKGIYSRGVDRAGSAAARRFSV